MERWTVGVRTYRRLALITTIGIGLLVVAGGVVRLTGSGLGCADWPNCNSERFVDVSSGHAAIEQINRIFSGLIGIPTLLLVVAAFRVRPQRDGLRRPAIGVLVTVLANGVVGGLAVRGDLHPALVQSHFLLAMASIALGMIAIGRSSPGDADDDAGCAVQPATRQLTTLLAVGTVLALITGTVVTGTGPHAGDQDARRFGFDISNVARLHSAAVIVALLVAVGVAWRVRRDPVAQRRLAAPLSAWIFLGFLQAGIGYTQYFTGVPEVLVGAHIAVATALWAVTVRIVDRANEPATTRSVESIASGAPSPV